MVRTETARSALRTATAADHDAVDRAFSGYDLGDPTRYADFLTAQAAAFLPVEAAIDRSDPARVVGDWPARRRSDLLRDDLAALGRSLPAVAPWPPFADGAAVLGAIYVLEGSRLGGTLLVRGVSTELPRSFLSANDPVLWRSLLAALEKELVTGAARATAVAAARSVFALFEKGARCRLNPPC